MMKSPKSGLVILLAGLLVLGGVPAPILASQEQSPPGALGLTIEEWKAKSREERSKHLQSLSKETRQDLLKSLKIGVEGPKGPERVVRGNVKSNARPRPEKVEASHSRSGRQLKELIWDPSALKTGDVPAGGSQAGGLIPPGIVSYETGNPVGSSGTGDFKGNRFDTKEGVPIPNSARFDKVSVYLVPSLPPGPYLPFQDPIVDARIVGPGGTYLGGGRFIGHSGWNQLNLNPPLHFDGDPINIGFEDDPGSTNTYAFTVSASINFYGTFVFYIYYYVHYSLSTFVLTDSTTIGPYAFQTTSTLPFSAASVFGGLIPKPLSLFTDIFEGTDGYVRQNLPYQRFVPAFDTMTDAMQGFHGVNIKAGGTVTATPNRNYLVRLIPLEAGIFATGHEPGDPPWSTSQPPLP